MSATVIVRQILHGASQRLVVVAPHTIASGYERRQASQYGWRLLVGWLLMAVLFGILVCALLQLPDRRHGGVQTERSSVRLHQVTNSQNGRLQGPVSCMGEPRNSFSGRWHDGPGWCSGERL